MKAKKYMLFELLCDILEKEKLERQQITTWLPGTMVKNENSAIKGNKGTLQVTEMFCILIVIMTIQPHINCLNVANLNT